jgi:hypothetical protein
LPGTRLTLVALIGLMGCDFGISNPGPVSDDALDDPAAHGAVVNGMARALSNAVGFVVYTGAIVTRELVASGHANPAALGVTLKQSAGVLDPGWEESNEHWRQAQQARWVAEDGLRRIREVRGSSAESDSLVARALLYVGYANRLLGENMCQAVFDGGPAEPRLKYFERSAAAFSEAAGVATAAGRADLRTAAIAGRASVRTWLGDWSGAVADASQVPAGFAFQAIYSAGESTQHNRIYAANIQGPRVHSVFSTFFESYHAVTKDPRTPWSTNPAFPTGTRGVPWYLQTKYTTAGAPVNLVTSREMRLIIAESLLRSADVQGAVGVINERRSALQIPLATATTAADAWAALARERWIEFWLEGRRLGDISRWKASGAPLQFPDMEGRDLCFPIGVSELDSNPNV